MSNSALEALHAANASYRKELEQIDAVSTSAASRCTPRFAQACDVQRVAWCPGLTYLARHVPLRMHSLAATQLTADGVFDAQEADAERAKAKTKMDKVRCSGACERA